MIHTFHSMGTVVSIRLADPPAGAAPALAGVENAFREADATFSRFRPDSPFTPHRPDGVIDLSGIVKALAIKRGATALRTAGFENWCINAGGDVLTSGNRGRWPASPPLPRWAVVIVDPDERDSLLTSIEMAPARPAIATSGSLERGDHIWHSAEHRSPEFIQVSVGAADIVTADVLATAIVSGGSATLHDVSERWSVDVLTIDRDGRIAMSPGFAEGMRGAAASSARAVARSSRALPRQLDRMTRGYE